MAPVQSLGFAELIQPKGINDHIRLFCQLYRFFQLFFIRFAVSLAAPGHADHLQMIILYSLCQCLYFRRIHHRRTGALVSGRKYKVANQSCLCL